MKSINNPSLTFSFDCGDDTSDYIQFCIDDYSISVIDTRRFGSDYVEL